MYTHPLRLHAGVLADSSLTLDYVLVYESQCSGSGEMAIECVVESGNWKKPSCLHIRLKSYSVLCVCTG